MIQDDSKTGLGVFNIICSIKSTQPFMAVLMGPELGGSRGESWGSELGSRDRSETKGSKRGPRAMLLMRLCITLSS